MATEKAEIHPVQTRKWATTDHHASNGGYQNIWGPYQWPSGFATAGWLLSKSWQSKPFEKTESRTIDKAEYLNRNGRLKLYWLGHSTVLIQSENLNILTDPIFQHRASPVSFAGPERLAATPLLARDLPSTFLRGLLSIEMKVCGVRGL